MTDWLDIPVAELPKRIPAALRERLGVTERQLQIVQLMTLGKSNKEMARILGCNDRTIEAHRAQMKLRTRFKTVVELAIAADRIFREASNGIGGE